MSSMISCGGRPSIVHPMFCAVPKISLAVPLNSRAIERGRNVRAMVIMSSNVMLPLCFTVKQMISNMINMRFIQVNIFRCFFWIDEMYYFKINLRKTENHTIKSKNCQLTVLDLFSVTWWFLQSLDDE